MTGLDVEAVFESPNYPHRPPHEDWCCAINDVGRAGYGHCGACWPDAAECRCLCRDLSNLGEDHV